MVALRWPSSPPHFPVMQTSAASSIPHQLPLSSSNKKAQKPVGIMIKSYSCSSFKNKIFENPVEGIVCYTDVRTGEVICEAYDEGPRCLDDLHQRQIPPAYRHHSSSRDVQIIINLLQQRLLQIVNGSHGDDGDQYQSAGGIFTPQEDLSKSSSV
ncbi:unnamed protein product [Linum tenue]|uniref:Uncharacterized protein n=1 Tax=Linum tenue TaxID=586396 RepID=A0AAV0PHP2_9ROSI|nr:unnamed protein product [Linum tenue]